MQDIRYIIIIKKKNICISDKKKLLDIARIIMRNEKKIITRYVFIIIQYKIIS